MSTSATAPQHPFSDLIFEAVCAHETFRKLGFSSDEMYFRPSAAKLHMTVMRGGLEFNFDLGGHVSSVSSLIAEWTRAAGWWNHAYPVDTLTVKGKVTNE